MYNTHHGLPILRSIYHDYKWTNTIWKNHLVKKLISSKDNFDKDPGPIHYYYGDWQPGFEELEKSGGTFHEGLPTSNNFLQTV